MSAAALASAGADRAPGAATCEAESLEVSSTDRIEFSWEMTRLDRGSVRAYHDFRHLETSTYKTVASSTEASTGDIATYGWVPPATYQSGTYEWRIWLWSGPGTPSYYPPGPYWTSCAGPRILLERPAAPDLMPIGRGVTDDGWRRPAKGQRLNATAAGGHGTRGESVRFQYEDGSWGPYMPSPAVIPDVPVRQAEAFSESHDRLTGSRARLRFRADVTPPPRPTMSTDRVEARPGAAVLIGGADDSESGLGHFEHRYLSPAGGVTGWQTTEGQRIAVEPRHAGFTVETRACDRVGNCSEPARVAIVATPATTPEPPKREHHYPASSATPVIEMIRPARPHGGAARLRVQMNRPAQLDITVGDAARPAWQVWVGNGSTLLRLPSTSRLARRAAVTIQPVAGSAVGAPAVATVRFPRATTKRDRQARALTRFQPSARFFLYGMDAAVREIVHPSDGGQGLGHARGAFRQEPSRGGLFSSRDRGGRLGKINERAIREMGAEDIAATLRKAIAKAPSHSIALDELTPMASDPKGPKIKGGRIPPPDPQSFASQFSRAMEILDVPSPYGGSWAGRIHVYLAPSVGSAIAKGRGPDRNLGSDGVARFRTYRTAMLGLARAGGVWVEMYRSSRSGLQPFTAEVWKTAPRALVAEMRRAGGDTSRLHFLLAGVRGYPRGRALPVGCVTPMRCAWALAESTSAGRMILRNGVGGYRLSDQARPWLAEWQARAS